MSSHVFDEILYYNFHFFYFSSAKKKLRTMATIHPHHPRTKIAWIHLYETIRHINWMARQYLVRCQLLPSPQFPTNMLPWTICSDKTITNAATHHFLFCFVRMNVNQIFWPKKNRLAWEQNTHGSDSMMSIINKVRYEVIITNVKRNFRTA